MICKIYSKNNVQKIYLIGASVSLFLLFYSILEMKPITVDINNFLGLFDILNWKYWVGLFLITFCSISIYINKNVNSNLIFFIISLVLGLFLFSVPIFGEENAKNQVSYYPFGEIKNLIKTPFIDVGGAYPLISYRSWPGFHFFSADLILIGNLSYDNIMKYFTLFWLICFILICFAIGISLKLSPDKYFILTILSLLSFWSPQYYYGPQSIVYILYLMNIYILLKFKLSSIKGNFVLLLIYISIIIIHLLTSIAIVLSIMTVVILGNLMTKNIKSRFSIFLIFLSIFASWYVFVAKYALSQGIQEIIRQLNSLDMTSLILESKFGAHPEIKQYVSYFIYSYLIVFLLLMTIILILYFSNSKYRRFEMDFLFYWLAGLSILIFFRYGSEIYERLYIYALVPMVGIIVKFVVKDRLFVCLIILFAILHIPAHYGDESFSMTRTSELEGASFLANRISPQNIYFYQFEGYVWYANTSMVLVPYRKYYGYESHNESILDNMTYVVNSNQIDNEMKYHFGFNPVTNWSKFKEINRRIYSNGFFEIMKNE